MYKLTFSHSYVCVCVCVLHTIIKSEFVGHSADFSNVGMEVCLNLNVTNVENGRQDGTHLLKLLHREKH